MKRRPAVREYAADQAFAALTDEAILGARVAESADRVVLRCRKRGLELHLYRSGKPARWYARPTVEGQRLRLNLGTLEALPTVADAHLELSRQLAEAGKHGLAGLVDRTTFGALCDEFMRSIEGKSRSKSIANYKGALALPAAVWLKGLKLRQIRRADIVRCLEEAHRELVGRGTKGTQVTVLMAALQSVWRFGLRRGRIEADLVQRLPRLADTSSRAVLATDDQLRAFWETTSPEVGAPISPAMARAFRCALLTGQRIGAMLLAKAEDVDINPGAFVSADIKCGLLTIHPQDGAKIKAVHVLPLPPMARAAFTEALDGRSGKVPVFPSDKAPHGHIKQLSASNAMGRLRAARPEIGILTLHDFRRTARTRIAGAVHREDAERWLSHVVGSVVERVYDRDHHIPAKLRAAEAWEAYLAAIGLR